MSRSSRTIVAIAVVAVFVAVAANEAIWLHAFGLLGSRAGLWGSFGLDSVEVQMQPSWYAIAKSSDYKGRGTSSPGLLAFKSEWPKIGASNQVGITRIDAEDASKLGAPGPHVGKIEKYPWGTAIFLRTGNAVFIPEAQLLVASGAGYEGRLSQAISEIQNIKITSRSSQSPQ